MKTLIRLIQAKQLNEAKGHLDRISGKLQPRDEMFFTGLLAQLMGDQPKAVENYTRLLDVFPNDLGATVNLAAIYNENGEYAKALTLLQPDKVKEDSKEYLFAVFDAYFGLRRYKEAEVILLGLLKEHSERIEILERQAALLLQLEDTEKAVTLLLRLAETHGTERPQIYGNLSAAYNRLGEYEKALAFAEKAVQGKPASWQFRLNRANSLMSMEQMAEAESILLELLASGHRATEILGGMARIENLKGNTEQSMGYCNEALQKSPEDATVLCCFADNLSLLGESDQAYANYTKSLAIKPNEEITNWHYALSLLRDRRFHEGWEQYKWGFKRKRAGRGKYIFDPNSEWKGQAIDESLLVWGEQGIGDELMFSKFLKYIPDSIKEIELRVDPRLVSVFNRRLKTRSGVTIKPYSDEPIINHIPIGNLPSVLWVAYEKDAEKLSPFLSRQAKNSRKPLRIGIAWRGGKSERMQSKRSVPLGLFRRLSCLLNTDVQIVMLQYNPLPEELAFLQTIFKDRVWLPNYDAYQDLDAWVDHIASCDLLVSVDNSAVHFAGAMGIPTLAMLPNYPDFRWGRTGSSNVWYESVTLLRGSDKKEIDALGAEIDIWLQNKVFEIVTP